MITTTRLVAPHFSGVHRGPAPEGDNSRLTFWNNGQQYHTSEEDTVELLSRRRADGEAQRQHAEAVRAYNRAHGLPVHETLETLKTSSSVGFLKTLAKREPNNQFQSALTRQKSSDVLDLLGNPEVQLSESDTPGSGNLPERLLGNEANFNHFSQALGGDKQAKSFITRVLAREIKSDLASGFQSGNWREQSVESRNRLVPKLFTKKRDDKDLDKSALKLAKEAVKAYLG